MTCREFADFIMDYLAGDLPADVASSFDRHVSVCANCDVYLAQYRATVEAGKAAFAEDDSPVPDDVPEELIRAILSSRRG
jgi:anti-sigma factor RsiW